MKKILFILLFALVGFGCEKEYFNKNPNDPYFIFDSFWSEVDKHYSYFQSENLNWDSVKLVYRKQINLDISNDSLFHVLGNMIGLLKDGHSNLAGWTDSLAALDASYNGWFLNYPLNQLRSIQYHYGIVFNSVFDYGITSKNAGSNGANFFGYIHIKTFNSFIDRKEYEAIDTLLKKLESNDGLIIDVRSNGGGNPDYADLIASRFAQTKKFTYKYRTRNSPGHNDFTGWTDSYLSPNYKYDKPIVVLTNRSTFSAAEGFVIDMKAQQSKTITIVGDTTGGGSSDPSINELPNGWIVRVSNTQRITFEGRDYQFTGIYPDVPVWIKQSDEQLYIDTIIEAAMDVLISKLNR